MRAATVVYDELLRAAERLASGEAIDVRPEDEPLVAAVLAQVEACLREEPASTTVRLRRL